MDLGGSLLGFRAKGLGLRVDGSGFKVTSKVQIQAGLQECIMGYRLNMSPGCEHGAWKS